LKKKISVKQEKHETLVDNIKQRHLGLVIEENQREYSNLVIEGRAIPSALDGLKPVHRRIFYSFKDGGFINKNIKMAKIVGHTMGSFHPHGDLAIVGALIDITQPFKNRNPLTIHQGNWGSIEGDSAAAPRYIEVKFPNESSDLLFSNLDKDGVVPWQSNYDDTTKEPIVLPTKYPFSLLNGTTGIAYANITTKIPSYNIKDLTNFYIYLIENKFWKKGFKINDHKKEILKIIPNVDFATGCNIYLDKDVLQEDMIFKPQFRVNMRASYVIDRKHNIITFTNLPYNVSAATIKEQASKAGLSFIIKDGKQIPKSSNAEILNISENIDIESISSFNDLNFKNDASLTFTFKKNSNLDLELIKVFKYTDLDTSFSSKMMFVDEYARPVLLSLYEQTIKFLMFRLHTFYKAFQYDIKKIKEQLHLLYGLLTIHNDLDTFIKIIRNSSNDDIMIKKIKSTFKVDDIQIDYLLSIQLRKLSKTSILKLKEDIKTKEQTILKIEKQISSKTNLFKIIDQDYKNQLEKSSLKGKRGKRLSKLIIATKKISKEDLIEDKEIILMYMEDDTIAFVDKSKYRLKQKNTRTTSNKINSDFELKLKISENCNIKDDVLLMSNQGRVFKIKAYNFSDQFKFIGNVLKLNKDEKIINILKFNSSEKYYYVATEKGKIKGINSKLFKNITSNRPITAIKLLPNDYVMSFETFTKKENEKVLVVTNLGKILKYPSNLVSILSGGNTQGIKNINLNEKMKEKVIKTIIYIETKKSLLIGVSNIGKAKKSLSFKIPDKKRAGASVLFFNNSKENGNLVSVDIIQDEDNEILMVLNELGDISLLKIKNFNSVNRTTKGAINLLKLQEGEYVKTTKKLLLNDLTETQNNILQESFEE